MQKQITTSKGELLFVKMPDDFDEIGDIEINIKGENFLSYFNGYEREDIWIDLPQGNWQLINLCKDITEEEAKDVVTCELIGTVEPYNMNWLYYDYCKSPLDGFETALESFKSLMQANDVYGNDNWVILKKLKQC